MDPTITDLMYLCLRCCRWGLKDAWGPGRVRCPHCLQVAPSGEEFQANPVLQVRAQCNGVVRS